MRVLDASALLAHLSEEPGWVEMEPALPGSFLSAVNLAGVLAKLGDKEVGISAFADDLVKCGVQVVPFDSTQASLSALSGRAPAQRACRLEIVPVSLSL